LSGAGVGLESNRSSGAAVSRLGSNTAYLDINGFWDANVTQSIFSWIGGLSLTSSPEVHVYILANERLIGKGSLDTLGVGVRKGPIQ